MDKEISGNRGQNQEAYLEWRAGRVESARQVNSGNLAGFLKNRLQFQRNDQPLEVQDFDPWPNPETALLSTYLELADNEAVLWEDVEKRKIDKVMAAYVSVVYDQLIANSSDQSLLVAEVVDDLYPDRDQVVLDEDESKALSMVMMRVGRGIDPVRTIFKKPTQ